MLINGTEVADLQEKLEELETAYVDLDEEHEALGQAYEQLIEQIKLTHGLLSLLIEEQGGIIEVDKQLLMSYDVGAATIKAYDDLEGEKLIIVVEVNE